MSTELHYTKAPIIEAVIDLRVTPVNDFDIEKFHSLSEALGESTVVKPFSFQLDVEAGELGDELEILHHQDFTGCVFTQKDEHQRFQARLDGFTFSRRAPYGRWSQFRDEARRVWNDYRALYPFEGVTRVALRYINQIATPMDFHKDLVLDDYLKIMPRAAFDASTSAMNGYFMQLQLRQTDLECDLIVNTAASPPTSENEASIILDFDLSQDRSASPWLPDQEEQMWEYLEALRVRKNLLFESSITEKLREIIR